MGFVVETHRFVLVLVLQVPPFVSVLLQGTTPDTTTVRAFFLARRLHHRFVNCFVSTVAPVGSTIAFVDLGFIFLTLPQQLRLNSLISIAQRCFKWTHSTQILLHYTIQDPPSLALRRM